MTIANPYLSDNLHFKPICARLGRGVLWTTTTLQKKASETEWHGHVVRFLSKATLFLGAVILVPLALIESVSLFIIGGLGIAINKFLCQSRSQFLQKYSLKAISYAIHSGVVTIAMFILGLKNPNLKYHTNNALVDQALYLGSAGFTQMTFGTAVDLAAGRSPQMAFERSLNLFVDSHPDLLNDIMTQIQRDFGLNLRERMREIPHMEAFLNRHPEDRDFIHNFNFTRLVNDQVYRRRAGEFLHRYLEEARVVRPQADEVEVNALRFELNVNSAEEAAYQNRLGTHVRTAFLDIHDNPAFARCLDSGQYPGKDLLEMFDASIYLPVAGYAQYKELLEPIQCPVQFSGNLTDFNTRRQLLITAQNKVNLLTPDQRGRLVEKILRGSDMHTQGPVQEAYIDISFLAAALHRGALMTKTAIDLREIEGGNVLDVRNLFQKACQDAVGEINGRPEGAAV